VDARPVEIEQRIGSRSVTIHLIRHAEAGSRRAWAAPDELRPLTPAGAARAERIAEELAGDGIARVLSSPYVRCVQSVEPLAARLGLEVELSGVLAEGARARAVRELVARLAAEDGTVALCSHGDVIPELLAGLARRGVLVDEDGRCPKGSRWALEVADGAVVRARYLGDGS